jgi:hypothetical protein
MKKLIFCYYSSFFAKFRKATISFLMSVCPSVCLSVFPHGKTRLPFNGISRHNNIFRKSAKKIYFSLKYAKDSGYFTRGPMYSYDNKGLFIMFSVITNIYNKKTSGPTLMELFTAASIAP